MNFDLFPLITPETSQKDWQSIFDSLPKWVVMRSYPPFDPDNSADPEQTYPVVIVVGKKHHKEITITLLQFAFLLEVNRLGHTVGTNINSGKPKPKVYVKQYFKGAANDNTPLARLFVDAGPNEAVKQLNIASDFRLENLYKIGAGKPTKQTLDVTLKHVERLAIEREAEGTLPDSLSVQSYVDNIRTLFKAVHAEAEESSDL
jgi:hypothetical protein